MQDVPTTGSSIVLDNAFLYSVAAFFNRIKNGHLVRNVNILGLSALADAIVMHQRLTVDKRGWTFFENSVPSKWLPYIKPYADIVDFILPTPETAIDALFAAPNALTECFALAQFDSVPLGEASNSLGYLYLSYTGSDIAVAQDEAALIKMLEMRTPKGIPDFQFNLRVSDHISTLQCLVRALQYQGYADARGEAYLSHEFRGRLLNLSGRAAADPAFRAVWEKVIHIITVSVEKEYKEKLEWTHDVTSESHSIWQRLETPLFLAVALQKCRCPEDLFAHVAEIRDRALPLRRLLVQLTGDGEKNSDLIKEARELSYGLTDTEPTYQTTKFSFRVGLPFSLALSMDIPNKSYRSIALLRDIYSNYSIPYTLRG